MGPLIGQPAADTIERQGAHRRLGRRDPLGGKRRNSHTFYEPTVIVLLTAWQYSHHIAPSLVTHRGPVLLLANFDGTWPGLVGMLCMAGSLTALGLPSETTLHDMRWGGVWEGEFVWDFEISGAVPFGHLKGGIADATGYRQPAMYFPKGGSTIAGQGKAGRLLWARAHYEGTEVILQVSAGRGIELPQAEFERRRATCYEGPLLNATLDGVGRDQLMAGHQSNHIALAYVDEAKLAEVARAFVAQALTQGLRVQVAGGARDFLRGGRGGKMRGGLISTTGPSRAPARHGIIASLPSQRQARAGSGAKTAGAGRARASP